MESNTCAICNNNITTKNDSKEHIIPNSIGGRRKITGFICNNCNNNSGEEWESELAEQLNPLSLLFDIKRDRGKVPSQTFETTGGDTLILNAEGNMDIPKPQYTEKVIETKTHININARSMKEAKKMLNGVKRKYPKIDLDDLITNAQTKSSYCPDMLQFNLSFGGLKAGRSLVKSALSLAVEAGIDHKSCEHSHDYLQREEAEACFGYYYERDLIVNRPMGLPLHCVHVQGDPKTKLLLGYVEYFGVQRMILCLSSSYKGENFSNTYAINPIDGSELTLSINIDLSLENIHDAYDYKKIPPGSVEEAFAKVIPTGMKASFEKEKSRVINNAVKCAFENCGAKEGEILKPEHMNKVSSFIMEKLEPFLLHQFSQNRKTK